MTGLALTWGGHALILASQFIFMAWRGGSVRVPVPSAATVLRAAAREWAQALRVFGWRQPFRSARFPDRLSTEPGAPLDETPRRGVVLVHGFVCNRGFWTPWLRELQARGHVFEAVNLEPVFTSIDDYAAQVGAAVERMRAATGRAPVLLCHSMGGLAARAWLRTVDDPDRVRHIVTVASPHYGTWIARFSQLPNGRQMRLHSPWIEALDRSETPAQRAKFTCWYSDCDNIVFPFDTAVLPGANSRFMPGQAHLALAFHPAVMNETLDRLARDDWPGPAV